MPKLTREDIYAGILILASEGRMMLLDEERMAALQAWVAEDEYVPVRREAQ